MSDMNEYYNSTYRQYNPENGTGPMFMEGDHHQDFDQWKISMVGWIAYKKMGARAMLFDLKNRLAKSPTGSALIELFVKHYCQGSNIAAIAKQFSDGSYDPYVSFEYITEAISVYLEPKEKRSWWIREFKRLGWDNGVENFFVKLLSKCQGFKGQQQDRCKDVGAPVIPWIPMSLPPAE